LLPARIIEAYCGEYASGKSEVAVNRAVELAARGRQVTLADLDLVEPCYTLRPLKRELAAGGVTVLAWETAELTGLGEAGNTLKPETRFCLRGSDDVVIDLGYGASGLQLLNLVEGAREEPDLRIYLVVNTCRPLTGSVAAIVEYTGELGLPGDSESAETRPGGLEQERAGRTSPSAWHLRAGGAAPHSGSNPYLVAGLLNNTHLGDETTAALVQEGAQTVAAAAEILGLPYLGSAVAEQLAAEMGPVDSLGYPVRVLHRYLPQAFW
jgi:hypothetical protein